MLLEQVKDKRAAVDLYRADELQPVQFVDWMPGSRPSEAPRFQRLLRVDKGPEAGITALDLNGQHLAAVGQRQFEYVGKRQREFPDCMHSDAMISP